jgi:hypothetical protein
MDVTSNEHKERPPAFGYEATREAAMAVFATSPKQRAVNLISL